VSNGPGHALCNIAVRTMARRMHLALPSSIMMMGLPDPSGAIPEGCCCVMLAGDSLHAVAAEAAHAAQQQAGQHHHHHHQQQQQQAQQQGVPCLAYRNPGMLPSDIRKLQLVAPPGPLRAMLGPRFAHGIFFSTRGTSCVAQAMAGGDYDGDLYLVMWEPGMVQGFRESPVPAAGAGPEQAGLAAGAGPAAGSAAQAGQAGFSTPLKQGMLRAAASPYQHNHTPFTPAGQQYQHTNTPYQHRQQQQTTQRTMPQQLSPAPPSFQRQQYTPSHHLQQAPATSMQACRLTPSSSAAGEEAALTAAYLHTFAANSAMKGAAQLWLRCTDQHGPGHPDSLALCALYYTALDAGKTGQVGGSWKGCRAEYCAAV
jgi:hypothetical protein